MWDFWLEKRTTGESDLIGEKSMMKFRQAAKKMPRGFGIL